jgi:hypothetical protein
VSTYPPVTVVCVFNDPEMRASCLDRSIEAHRSEMPQVEYIPVDNTEGKFSSAGAALNHGASQASHDYLVFVHQDVYLHSLASLGRAALAMSGGDIGLLGAVGIAADGRVVGRIRDRVVLIGDSATSPQDVDSVDEVLFMAPTAQILAAPLTESPEFAWHAYAIEYGLRMRAGGKRVAVMDLPLTHNSMSTNLARLAEAHSEIARLYPSDLPIRTTCGLIRAGGSGTRVPRALQGQRWRYRWLRNSLRVRRAQAAAAGSRVVLNDIRMDIDAFLAGLSAPLAVVNLEAGASQSDPLAENVRLPRGDRDVETQIVSPTDVSQVIEELASRQQPLLITNATTADLDALRRPLSRHRRLAGFHQDLGWWVLVGTPVDGDDDWLWQRQGTVPLMARSR